MFKRIKPIFVFILVFIYASIFSGCWNYREVNDLSIVAGLAVDRSPESHNYVLTVEIASSESTGPQGGITPRLLRSEGATLFDAIRNMVTLSAKRLYWSHAQVAIISKDIAYESLIPEIDWLNRDAETRSDMYLLVSGEKTAAEILDGEPQTEETVSYFLVNMLQNRGSVSKFVVTDIWRYISEYRSETIVPVIGTVRLKEISGKKIPHIEGAAIMKNDKLTGFLDGEDTKYMLFINNKLQGGILPQSVEPIKGVSRISLEIFNSKTKIVPALVNDELTVEVKIKTDVAIAEMQSSIDYIQSPQRKYLQDAIEKNLEERVKETMSKIQTEYDSDVFGIEREVQIKMPKYWKQVKGDWDEMFRNLPIKVTAEMNIRGSSTVSKALEIGDPS